MTWKEARSMAYLNNMRYIHGRLNRVRNDIAPRKKALGALRGNNGDLTCLNITHPLYNIIAYRKGGSTTRGDILQLAKQHNEKDIRARDTKTF